MNKTFFKYLILPKGIQSIFYKLYVYLIPFLISLGLERDDHLYDFFILVLLFILFEIVINPARYQLNDVKDFREDLQRGNRWIKPVSERNKKIVLLFILLRCLIGFSIAFLINPKLFILALSFILLQLLYDYLFKPRMPIMSVISISIAYPLRSLAIFFGLNMTIILPYLVLMAAMFFYAFYTAMQWRRHESFFILENGLVKKPFIIYFSGGNTRLLIDFSLIMFLVLIILSISSLMNVGNFNASSIVLFCIIFGLFLRHERLKLLNNYMNNIIVIDVFSLLIRNDYLIVLIISVNLTYLLLWYNDFYINDFAEKYFSKIHYE